MDVDNISKNIRNLRIAYGETQMDLAYALGLESPAAIANYEKGTRKPKPKVRKKIAAHYMVTEDELEYGNFSRLNIVSLPLDDIMQMREMTTTFLPIICTDEALTDPLFRKGYEAHISMYKDMKVGKEIDQKDFDICIKAYIDSCESNDTTESAVNCLWWFLLNGFGIANAHMVNGLKAMEKKQIEKAEFLKNYYLYNSDDEVDDERKKERQELLDNVEEVIITLLQKLKASAQWSDLADYYTALRYTFCIVDNNLSDDMNRTVGGEMMLAIATLGNKYANTFLRLGIDASKK
ncbi:helix-turn-helix transcriptional regulator [Clostridium sp. YIM B02505]|uniref:Helix-turn-helix transcriptional regulator n=1 Tax=Clostridium yunnanense TaxID=2800325 RepID=A0ABS1EQF7_9CLOT|nr:helix-turn-helix transcriptional regulator [Clostridium yunnanense]MBK1811643.1 helix-turn-helix transcriptional regulator [Clostridium yunnanense]